MKNRYSCTGFTLAELLAVVIIVALLSAMSVGYYKRAVEQSRFAEGLSAASAVVEAVNQSHFDQQLDGVTPTKRPKIKTLDVSIANQSACASPSDYCVKTPHFEIKVDTNGNVLAYRGTTTSYKYYINIQPSFADTNKDKITCEGDANAKTFCESMGYTTCSVSSSYVCSQS